MAENRGGEPTWQRAKDCAEGGCVEVMFNGEGDGVILRSSLQPATTLRLTTDEWTAFRDRMAAGDYD